ncbi:hypothetical protein ABPG75_006387 [Micractinium tetrahymenae]
MEDGDVAGLEAQPARPRVGRPRRGTALQQPQQRPRRGKRAASPAAAAPAPCSNGGRGRGRKRQRQQAPEPPPPPAQPEEEQEQKQDGNYSHGAASEDAHSDGGSGSDSEAAALAAVAQAEAQAATPPAPAAPQLSVREQARQLLVGMCIPEDRADQALEEAEEQAEGSFADPAAWAEQAQFVMACRVEFEEERDQLAQAMDVSLQEEQRRKQAQLPLHERPDEEIWREFSTSAVLQVLAARASLASLLSPPLRQPLLDYLQLEKRCKKWYGIACHFFRAQAEQLAPLLGDAAPAATSAAAAVDAEAATIAAAAAAAAAGGSDGTSNGAAATAAAAAPAAAGGSGPAPGLPAISEDLAAVLAAELSERQEQVQAAVYSMPAGSDSTAVPELFSAAVPEGAQAEVVEVLSDSDGEEGGAEQQQQQQQQQEQQEGREQQNAWQQQQQRELPAGG